MKGFFKYVFASMIGFVLAYIVIAIIMISIIAGITSHYSNKFSKNEQESIVKEKSILMLDLNKVLVERVDDMPFSEFSFIDNETFPIGLKDVMDKIKKAKEDPNISGIYLNTSIQPASLAMLNELRNVLIDFKKSKKFIYTYSEVMTQGAYFIASVSDKIYIQPEGMVILTGFSSENLYLKGMFDKLEIEPTLIRAGSYKSAGETFIRNDMSSFDRKQMEEYLFPVYDQFLNEIAKARGISVETIKSLIDNLSIRQASDAVKFKLVDGALYKDEFFKLLREKTNKDKLNLVKISQYSYSDNKKKEYTKDKIALIYAVGNIASGQGNYQNIGSESLSKALRQAREDENIKAIVLRINSPGGGALPSDVIWREVKLAADKKPLVVSMGALAASGGYYIAAPADSIIADPFTITGSIGVFGVHLNMQKFWNNKLGVNFDRVKTSKYADFGSFNRPLSPEELAVLQFYVDDTYTEFKKKVADGRNLKMSIVDSIAQGHIWSGKQALKLGLIDKIGGIYDAIDMAASMAKLKNYRIKVYPKAHSVFENLGITFSQAKATILTCLMGKEDYELYSKIKAYKSFQGGEYMLMTMEFVVR